MQKDERPNIPRGPQRQKENRNSTWTQEGADPGATRGSQLSSGNPTRVVLHMQASSCSSSGPRDHEEQRTVWASRCSSAFAYDNIVGRKIQSCGGGEVGLLRVSFCFGRVNHYLRILCFRFDPLCCERPERLSVALNSYRTIARVGAQDSFLRLLLKRSCVCVGLLLSPVL